MDDGRSPVVKPKHNRSDAALKTAVAAAIFSLWIAGAFAQAAGAVTFQNTNSIFLPAFGPALPPYQGSPYPSIIGVSNVSGEITRVTVNLVQFTHSDPDVVDIMLMGPGGQKVLLMSDAGGDNPVGGAILNFSDTSTVFLPDSTRIVSGSYRPSNYETAVDGFPSTPSGALNSSFAIFDGTNPNGLWLLYAVSDSMSPNGGMVAGGWQLSIITINPPVITKQPQDETVSPGDIAQFAVDVAGTPPFEFQWLRNGQVYVPFGQGNATLRIPNVSPQHAGRYSVVVRNVGGQTSVQSREASLFVLGPVYVVEPPRDWIVPPGTNVTFSVRAAGNPPLRYRWRRNGIWLPGETNETLFLPQVQVSQGGHYSVIIMNGDDAVTSEPGLLKVLAANGPPPTDEFRERPVITLDHGILQADSEKATAQANEALSLGGGKTMWFEWVPSQNGIVRFSMLGSSFDTLLTVFPPDASGQPDMKRVVTKDDDRAGFYSSQLAFNAEKDRSYFVQIDGFGLGGSGGEFTVKWDLEPGTLRIPVIVTNPVPQSVRRGDRVTFSAVIEPTPAGFPQPSFQWFFNNTIPLPNQTGPTLTINNVLPQHVGFYSLRVSSSLGLSVFSPAVPLQLGFPPGFFMNEKPEMMLLSGGLFVPIGIGGSVYNDAPWPAGAKAKDPNPCGNAFNGTLWQGLLATNTGPILVQTTGSVILTRMAIYRLTGTTNDFGTNNPPLVCDVTNALDGLQCAAKFDALSGTNYTIVVEGYNAPTGTIQVTSIMGVAPPLTNALKYCLVFETGSIQLSMPATNWFPAPVCQWFRDGNPITDATNATLDVTNFGDTDIGTYSVWMSNFVSTVTRQVAYLDIAPPFELHYSWVPNGGGTGFKITGSNAAPFVLQTTTDLSGLWTPIATNPDPCLVLYYTNGPPVSDPQRFYRAVPWSPGP